MKSIDTREAYALNSITCPRINKQPFSQLKQLNNLNDPKTVRRYETQREITLSQPWVLFYAPILSRRY